MIIIRKRPTVALSVRHVEYLTLAATIQQAKLLIALLNDIINSNENGQTTVFWDSQVSITVSKNPVTTKHADIRNAKWCNKFELYSVST